MEGLLHGQPDDSPAEEQGGQLLGERQPGQPEKKGKSVEIGRGRDQDQPADPLGVPEGQQQTQGTSQRVAPKDDLPQPQLVQKALDFIGEGGQTVVGPGRFVRTSGALQVQGVKVTTGGLQERRRFLPGIGRGAQTVKDRRGKPERRMVREKRLRRAKIFRGRRKKQGMAGVEKKWFFTLSNGRLLYPVFTELS
jgi:hypothetical protein